MSRYSSLSFVALLLAGFAVPALAEDGDDHHNDAAHEVSVGQITVVHPWARAASAGGESLVFFEVLNAGAPMELSSAETDAAASVEIVGAMMGGDGRTAYQPVGAFSVPSGDFDFDPKGLGLRLTGLTRALVKGESFHLHLHFADGTEVELDVEIEAADATRHSHAGHSH